MEIAKHYQLQLELVQLKTVDGFLSCFQICCLCNLRGGALKPTTTQEWAHIVCAMAITEVSFENVKLRGPINVTNLSPARLKLVSYICLF